MQSQYFPHELRTLAKLKLQGFTPSTVYDIGASSGIWSEAMLEVVPYARYHLFEPLAEHASLYINDLPERLARCKNLTLHVVALGETNGTAEMLMFKDAYGSSLLDPGYAPVVDRRIDVPLVRLDDYVQASTLPPPDVIKIDCQGAEASILRGGPTALGNANVVFLETWLKRAYGPKTPLLWEIIEMLGESGFTLMDFGERFYDEESRLYSVDAVFYSESLLEQLRLFRVPATDSDRLALAARLLTLIGKPAHPVAVPAAQPRHADLIVSHAEINSRHGVGVLLGRLFEGREDLIAVRSREVYRGETSLAGPEIQLTHGTATGNEVFRNVLKTVQHAAVRRILCVPYYADDVKTAIASKEIFNVPLCTFMMDDQNVFSDGIPDKLMRSLLEKSTLRLAISPELGRAYAEKYRMQFWYMPPVVPDKFIPKALIREPASSGAGDAVMIGNIWGAQWLDRLRLTIRNSGIDLSWYSNGGFDELGCSREDLAADRVFAKEPLADEDLVGVLRNRRFAVVPSGTLEPGDDRSFLARLSMPSRLIFMMATSHIPIIVLGHPDTAAAKFVNRFGLGLVSVYRKQPFMEAVREISKPETNLAMRRRAHALAPRFSDLGALEWIWQSLERGSPADERFEELLKESPATVS